MFQKILISVDESPSSEDLFTQAVTIAQKFNAELILLHVLSPLTDIYPIGVPMYPGMDASMDINYGAFAVDTKMYAEMKEKDDHKSHQFLDLLAKKAGDVPVKCLLETGDPGDVICQVARENQADLVIVGTHGLTGVKELLLGSVSNYVVHHSPCAVLTLPVKV
jgi:nucleotide-binding universal stress UspA family protein